MRFLNFDKEVDGAILEDEQEYYSIDSYGDDANSWLPAESIGASDLEGLQIWIDKWNKYATSVLKIKFEVSEIVKHLIEEAKKWD